MPGPKSYRVVELSDAQRDELLAVLQDPLAAGMRARRADIVLRAAAGGRLRAIAREVGVRRDVVRKWIDRYLVHGLAGLEDLPRPGRPKGDAGPAPEEDYALPPDLERVPRFDWSRLEPARRGEVERALAMLGLIHVSAPALRAAAATH